MKAVLTLLTITTVLFCSCHSNDSSFTITDVRASGSKSDSIKNRLLGQHLYITFYDKAAKMIFNNQMPEIALLKNDDGTYTGRNSTEPKMDYTLTVTNGLMSVSEVQLSFISATPFYGTGSVGDFLDHHSYVTAKKD